MRRFTMAGVLALSALCLWSLLKAAAPGPAPAYSKAEECAECHAGIAAAYARTGMGRSWFALTEQTRIEDVHRNNKVEHRPSARFYEVTQRSGHVFLRREQKDAEGRPENVLEKELHFVLGSGNHARSYVHRTPGGKLFAAPLSWYSGNGGYWEMAPGYEAANHIDFRRELTAECLFCHTAYPNGSGLPRAIDCQRCHGPGSAHVVAARSGKPAQQIRAAIVNPSRLARDRQLDICFQCHLQTTSDALPHSIRRSGRDVYSFRPGESLGEYQLYFDHAPGAGHDDKFEVVQTAYRLRQSACFRRSGTMTCTTCHDPHSAQRGDAAVAHYRDACLRCHQAKLSRMVAGGSHSPDQRCVSCHMASRNPSDALRTSLTDHYIQRRPATTTMDETHSPYRGEVVPYYPKQLPRTPESEFLLALAQVRDGANDRAGMPRFLAALDRYPEMPLAYRLAAAEVFRRKRDWHRALPLYARLAQAYPADAEVWRGWGQALLEAEENARAVSGLEHARELTPLDPRTLHLLGDAYLRSGRIAEAQAALRECARIDPDRPECFVSLGVAAMRSGNEAEALTALKQAVNLAPELAGTHASYAAVLTKSDLAEALRHYRLAIALDPSLAEAHAGYGSALLVPGDWKEARQQWEIALRLNSRDAMLHVNLGTLLAKQGEREGAAAHYRDALAVRPNLAEAHLNLGITLAQTGRSGEALVHLRKAEENGNPAVRDAARRAASAIEQQ